MGKQNLISFDLEEFDLPSECGKSILLKEQMRVSREGLKNIIFLLNKYKIKATFFITANFAKNNHTIIKKISRNHEIASHGFFHSNFKTEDLKNSKKVLEKIIKKEVLGFRMPRMKSINPQEILKAGYKYDSSINPAYLPGRYNNFRSSRRVSILGDLTEIPSSTTPLLRFPLFWISFKNLPLPIFRLLSSINLMADNYLCLYFHPWEFAEIGKYQIPYYVKNPCGLKLLKKLEKYLVWLKSKGEFITFFEFLKQRSISQ